MAQSPNNFDNKFASNNASAVPYAIDTLDDEQYPDSNTATGRQSSEEAEARQARSHELYSAAPQQDELYHCPYVASENCQHKPTKLKCVYDKYIDSHLRPFRCKNSACTALQFSSTACLLRHEREAHGMHGHGAKPHLCSYKDCERALPGNGFPRRYNLFDHMKRVHDYKPPSSPPHSNAASTSQKTQGPRRQNSRKRKASEPSAGNTEETSEKRTSTGRHVKTDDAPLPPKTEVQNVQQVQQSRKISHARRLQASWGDAYNTLRRHFDELAGPEDFELHQTLTKDIAALHQIAEQFSGLG
ncbi:MAG: hypothetical protein M1820_000435 [Bogoriella megaspora]|nr:MAG: hypothetical protein M1820_000435 [Bogoriella megaspora]